QEAVTNAVMRACNGTFDGAQDGLVDSARCHFDPRSLIGTHTACGTFTARDAEVVKKIWQGPRDSKGRFLWYGLTPGSQLGSAAGIALASTGPDATGALVAQPFDAADDWLRYWIHENPSWTYHQETRHQYERDFATSVRRWRD